MAKVSAEEYSEKWNRRIKAGLTDMRKGVEKVTEAPGKKAAEASDKMKARINEAIDSGKWGKNVAAISVDEWKSKMINKGIPRVSGGADAAKDKVASFAAKLLPAVDAAAAKAKSMPSLTLEDNIARMTTFIREMAKFKK